jgi:cytochrome b561
MAGGVLACFGIIQYKQSMPLKTDEQKEAMYSMMFWHKSFGTLCCLLLAPRLLTRMVSRIPASNVSGVEAKLAKFSHLGTYALLTTMCATGAGMGLFNGGGLPFFREEWHIPAPKEYKNTTLGGWMFKTHKYAGVAMQYAIALHVGAVGYHYLRMAPVMSKITGPAGKFAIALPYAAVAFAVAASVKLDGLPPHEHWYNPYYVKPKVEAKKD